MIKRYYKENNIFTYFNQNEIENINKYLSNYSGNYNYDIINYKLILEIDLYLILGNENQDEEVEDETEYLNADVPNERLQEILNYRKQELIDSAEGYIGLFEQELNNIFIKKYQFKLLNINVSDIENKIFEIKFKMVER